MEKILTIVIPAYNVEQTLQQTVESMLVPDRELRQSLDILIVNDGSKDGTLALAKQFETENPGIVRVWNKENGGHGSTINVGIEQGYGKYMKVVDGDDWLDTQALEKYLHILSEADADIVATDYYQYYSDIDKWREFKTGTLPYGEVKSFREIYEIYNFSMHAIAVKSDLLRDQPYRIDEHCFYVDVEYYALAAILAETVLYVDLKLYVYRLNRVGQSVSVEGWMKHYKEHACVALRLIEWHKDLFPNLEGRVDKRAYLEKRIIQSSGGHYLNGLIFPQKARAAYALYLKEYDKKIKNEGQYIYELCGKRRGVRLFRVFHFSILVYSLYGTMWQLVEFAKNIIRRNVYGMKRGVNN